MLILALEAQVDPALVAAVGSLGWIDTLSRPSGYGPVPHEAAAMRGYGAEVNLALALALAKALVPPSPSRSASPSWRRLSRRPGSNLPTRGRGMWSFLPAPTLSA